MFGSVARPNSFWLPFGGQDLASQRNFSWCSLRLCVSALRRVALRFWRSLRFNNPAAASEFICVICGYIWEVEMTKLVGGNNGAIQTGGVICVYLRDLRFLLGGFALRLCVRFRPIQFEKPSTGGFVGF